MLYPLKAVGINIISTKLLNLNLKFFSFFCLIGPKFECGEPALPVLIQHRNSTYTDTSTVSTPWVHTNEMFVCCITDKSGRGFVVLVS